MCQLTVRNKACLSESEGGVVGEAEVKEEVQESSTVNAEYKLKTSQVNWRRNRKKPIGS